MTFTERQGSKWSHESNHSHFTDEGSVPTARRVTMRDSTESFSRGRWIAKPGLPAGKGFEILSCQSRGRRGNRFRKCPEDARLRRGASSELIPLRESAGDCGAEASIGLGGGARQPRRSRRRGGHSTWAGCPASPARNAGCCVGPDATASPQRPANAHQSP